LPQRPERTRERSSELLTPQDADSSAGAAPPVLPSQAFWSNTSAFSGLFLRLGARALWVQQSHILDPSLPLAALLARDNPSGRFLNAAEHVEMSDFNSKVECI
jgi:hypothetical protein